MPVLRQLWRRRCVFLCVHVCVCDVFMLQARAELSGVAYYMQIVVNYSC